MKHAAMMIVALSLATVSPVGAQETTGGLQGGVTNEVGTPIVGAVVEAMGPSGKLSTTSDADGRYRFPRLAPGSYTVTSSFEGMPRVEAESVRVILGEAVTVDFVLRRSTFEDEIQVYSDTVAIDFTESQTATSIRQWEIDYLPRGRDFTDVVTFAPGTVLNYQGGGIMVDGASGLENRYVIDGIDTTDPQNGSAAIPMRAEMMEEVQVKSAGYTAEFGGSVGGVINAVTRSGSNELHGAVFVDIENNQWNGTSRPQLEESPCTRCETDDGASELVIWDKDDETRYDPGFFLGGPILRDRWWFFAAYRPGIRATKRTVDWEDADPPVIDEYRQDFRVDYVSFNTTVNIGSALLLKAGLNHSPYTIEGSLPNRDGRAGLPDQENWALLGTEGERQTYSLTADWILSDSVVLSGRGGFYRTNVNDTGIPILDLVHIYSGVPGFVDRYPEIPAEWQNDRGWRSDNIRRANQKDVYERTAVGLDATWFLTAAGEHSLKAGYQNEEIYNDVRRGLNADGILYYWDRTYTTTEGEVVTGTYGYFQLFNRSTLGEAKTSNRAFFVQDAWSVLPNLTLNIGVRSENEAVPNFGATGPDPAIAFGWGDKLAPRLGFAWDVKNNARWKVFGSFGTYYDVTKYEMPRGSFGGDRWVDFFYTFDSADPGLNDAETCRTGSNTIFERPICPAGTLIEIIDQRLNAADPATWAILGYPTIEPDMKPMESWELQLGVDHQLTSVSQLGARVVHKEIVRTIEDVGLLWPGVGAVYIIGNPGEGVTAGYELPYVKPVREYDALEIIYEKRFTNNWSLRAYYTLSRLWGNYSGLANSDEINSYGDPLNPVGTGGRRAPNFSRLWDVAGSAYDQNGDPVYGRLATDRTHQFGAQFLYSFPWGFNVGVNQYIGSGTPLSTMGSIPEDNTFYPYGRGDLGDTPALTQTDLTLYYTFHLGGDMALSAGLTVLNLFDEDTPTRMWARRQVQDLAVTNEDFLTGFDYEEELASLGADELDTAFGLWDTFQLPREIRLTLKFEF